VEADFGKERVPFSFLDEEGEEGEDGEEGGEGEGGEAEVGEESGDTERRLVGLLLGEPRGDE